MKNLSIAPEILFEISDIFGKKIRTTHAYWTKITSEKHAELIYTISDVQNTLQRPDLVYRSVTDDTIALYRKQVKTGTLIVVAKHLNGEGFLVTAYETTKTRIKGERLWPKT